VEINTAQVRAARALLDWTQVDLALEDAGVIFENDGRHVGVKLKIKRGK
jgi:hypothetical protein